MTWSFQPVGGPWFTAIVAAMMLALVLVVPRPRPTGGRLWTLRGLRLLIVLLVLVSLTRPTLIRTESKPLEATLLVLVDSSRSMRVADSLAGESRWDAARRMLADSAGALRDFAERWDIRAYRFSDELAEAEIADGVIVLPESAEGDTTALGAALDDLLERGGGERLLGVVLLSDGAPRALAPRDVAPPIAARRLAAEGVPLFAATFGRPGSGDRADLAVEDLAASESAFVKAPTEVAGRVRANGFAGRTLTVQLLWEGADGEMAVVASETIRTAASSTGGAYPFRLTHTPTQPGEQKLSVRVATESGGPAEGELITSNNQRSTFITVRDGGVKVLYLAGAKRIGGTPGLEQRFVRAALDASPDVVVTRRVFDYRQLGQNLRLGGDGATPDVVILDDLDATALSVPAWQSIAQLVRDGAGLAMLGGRQSFGPGGFRSNPVAAVLPLRIGPAERQNLGEPFRRDVHLEGPLRVQPTDPFGLSHPIMNLGPQSADVWPKLPPLDGANRFDRRGVKPNAIVLAETGGPARRPLLVIGQSGAGRTLAMAADSTWRWRLEGFGEPHRRFWRQLVLWLARKDDATQDPVWVKLDSRRVARGSRLDLRLGVRGEAGDDAEELRYEARVVAPAGKTFELATGAGAETTALFADTQTPGDYTVEVRAYDGPTPLGEAAARFAVPDQDLELDNPSAEPSLMAQLAAATSAAGGRAIAPEELPTLFQQFAEKQPELEEEVLARITYWDSWPFFLLLVGLLGTEWYLRKRWGLV
ncbi:MAG: glutamine amidotransferase [Planctomycetota bacterium]